MPHFLQEKEEIVFKVGRSPWTHCSCVTNLICRLQVKTLRNVTISKLSRFREEAPLCIYMSYHDFFFVFGYNLQ